LNHQRRAANTSGRSCSIAWPVLFFTRDVVTRKKTIKACNACAYVLFQQSSAHLHQRRITVLLIESNNQLTMSIQAKSSFTAMPSFKTSSFVLARAPTDHRRRRNTKVRSSPTATHASLNCTNRARPQIHR
jgi:nitrogen-specific signal transduction histidine kinase